MAIRVRSITPGKYVKGRFVPNPSGKMTLGKGGRFEKCVAKVMARGGAQDPNAVCGAAGMKKYGKKRMEKWAHKAKPKRKNRRRN